MTDDAKPAPRRWPEHDDVRDWLAGVIFRIEDGAGAGRPVTLSYRDLPSLYVLHNALLAVEAQRARDMEFRNRQRPPGRK